MNEQCSMVPHTSLTFPDLPWILKRSFRLRICARLHAESIFSKIAFWDASVASFWLSQMRQKHIWPIWHSSKVPQQVLEVRNVRTCFIIIYPTKCRKHVASEQHPRCWTCLQCLQSIQRSRCHEAFRFCLGKPRQLQTFASSWPPNMASPVLWATGTPNVRGFLGDFCRNPPVVASIWSLWRSSASTWPGEWGWWCWVTWVSDI